MHCCRTRGVTYCFCRCWSTTLSRTWTNNTLCNRGKSNATGNKVGGNKKKANCEFEQCYLLYSHCIRLEEEVCELKVLLCHIARASIAVGESRSRWVTAFIPHLTINPSGGHDLSSAHTPFEQPGDDA